MANVMFKKGLRANLPTAYAEGTFYVTTDERAIYLDVSDSARIRLGDFQEFATVAALEANPNPSTTALYYVSGINCLAKWDGSKYVQINRDTGMTEVEVVGKGNAVTAAVYSADGRKLTLTKGATYATAGELSALSTRVGELEAAGGEKNKLEKVKVNGAELTIDSGKAVNIKIEESANNGKIKVNDLDVAIHGLGSAAFVETTAFDAAGKGAEEAGKVKSALDTYKVEANAAIEAAAAKGQQGINDAAGALAAAQAADAKAVSEAAAALAAAKSDAATKYVTQTAFAEADADIRADFAEADTALKNELTPLINAKVAQSDYNTKMNALDKSIEDLGKEDVRLAGLITANQNAIAEVDGKVGGHETRLNAVETFFVTAEGETLDAALDTLVEIQKYITEDGAAAEEMLKAIEDVEKAIEDEAKARASADTTLGGEIEALAGVVNGKVAQGDFDTLKGRVDAAEGDIDTLQNDLDKAEEDIAGLKTSKADTSVVTTLSTNFTNYKEEHAGDYTNAQIDAAIDADVKVVNDALTQYKNDHANDYTNAQVDNKVKGAADAAAAALGTAKEELQGAINKEASDRATAITNAIAALDSDIAADAGYALTKVAITDGKLTAKEQAKFATENYVAEQITAALVWGGF